MSPFKLWPHNFDLNSTEKLLLIQLVSVALSVTSYLSSISAAYKSVFEPFSVHSLLYVLSVTVFSIIVAYYFKLPLPDDTNVESIFGPSNRMIDNPDKRTWKPEPKKNFTPLVIGHRASGWDATENSLTAIRKCASRGCSMVEFDVSLTKDFVPVLFHDDDLLRVIGVKRRISEVNWGDLKQFRISEETPSERVPTLVEAVDTCLELGMRFIVDLKEEHDKLIEAVVNVFRKYGKQAYCLGAVSSFYFRVIYKVRVQDPNIVGCIAWRPMHFAVPIQNPNFAESSTILEIMVSKVGVPLIYGMNDFAMNYIYWWMLGLSAVLVHKDALNVEIVERFQEKGLRVFAWTVNCPLEKQYFSHKLKIGYLTDTLMDSGLNENDDPVKNLIINMNTFK